MKLRLKGDTLRIRLTQGEVVTLAKGGVVREETPFGPGSGLVYRVQTDMALTEVEARFANSEIVVKLPLHRVQEWAGTVQVGIHAEQRIGTEQMLRIAIEKDFACLTPRLPGEDADAFPNPANQCKPGQ